MKKSQRLKFYELQKGICAITRELLDYSTFEIHHAGVHNTKANRKRFPLFIDSFLNCYAVNKKAHTEQPFWGKISEREAEAWERFLEAWLDVVRVADSIEYNRVLATLKSIRQANAKKFFKKNN